MTVHARAHPQVSGRLDRYFYTGMSLACLLVVFVGFAPSYYLRSRFFTDGLPAHLHAHGLLFSVWIVFMVGQTWLISAGRRAWHRALGPAGAALAALMAISGVTAGIMTARREAALGFEEAARAFLTIPMFSMAVFAGLVAAGILWRGRPQTHKRLMLLATISILDAPIARWPGAPGQFGVSLLTDLFIAAAVLYDVVSRRRVHPATIAGGLVIAGNQALRDVAGRSEAWHALTRWLIG